MLLTLKNEHNLTTGADAGSCRPRPKRCGIKPPLLYTTPERQDVTEPKPNPARPRGIADMLGMALSGTCMVHCMLLPFAVAALPFLQYDILEEETFHILMLAVILPTSLGAFVFGAWRHRDMKTIALGLTALVLLILTAFFGHAYLGYVGERIATTIAGALLAAAHIINYRRSRHVGVHAERV